MKTVPIQGLTKRRRSEVEVLVELLANYLPGQHKHGTSSVAKMVPI